jgi:hypothetical protein
MNPKKNLERLDDELFRALDGAEIRHAVGGSFPTGSISYDANHRPVDTTNEGPFPPITD